MRAGDKKRGFTLLEVMIVVSLIAVAVGVAAPAMTDTIRDRKTYMVARDVVRLFRNAASMSMGRGTAYMVTFQATEDNGRGRLNLYRGDTPTCIHTDWTAVRGGASGDDCVSNDQCVDYVHPKGYLRAATREAIKIQGHDSLFNFCYQTGRLRLLAAGSSTASSFWQATNTPGSGGEAYGRGMGFHIARFEMSGSTTLTTTSIGVARRVFVPFDSGVPRILQAQ